VTVEEPPIGVPLRLVHPALPREARVWGAGRPGYPDEPPATPVVAIGAKEWRGLGVTRVLSLIEDWELPRRAPGLYEALGEQDIALVRLPVRDFGVPTDLVAYARLLAEVRGWLAAGEGLLVHCNAGLGRTAVVLGSLLRIHGLQGDPVTEIRRIYRRTAMEHPVQEAFVRGLDPVLGGAGAPRNGAASA
jgi:protein-tyrosine phosphatase